MVCLQGGHKKLQTAVVMASPLEVTHPAQGLCSYGLVGGTGCLLGAPLISAWGAQRMHVCAHSLEGQRCPGLHQKRGGQQGERGRGFSPSALLS